jgi:shikimate 5-dehydrogenase
MPPQTYHYHPHLYVDEGMAVCNAVYRPDTETPLVREACKRGTRAVTGERMLLNQGVLDAEAPDRAGTQREGDG